MWMGMFLRGLESKNMRIQNYLPPPDFTLSMDEDIVRRTRIAIDAYTRDHPTSVVVLPADFRYAENSEAGGRHGKGAKPG